MINPFDSLDAQSAESHLAQIEPLELAETPNPLDADMQSLRDILLDDIRADIEVQWLIDEANFYSIGLIP